MNQDNEMMQGCVTRIAHLLLVGLLFLSASLAAEDTSISQAETVERDFTSIIGGTRVIGGGPAYTSQFPSVVALVRDGFSSLAGRQFCGGTVVATRWVITAAHCLYDGNNRALPASSIRIIEGITDLQAETPDEEIVVTNLYIHPGYDHAAQSAYDDIALIEVATEMVAEPVSLFSGNVESLGSANAMIVGWGATNYENPQRAVYPDIQQFATVPLVSNELCNDERSYDGYVGGGQLCAGFEEGGVDGCVGDSGGPLFVDTGNGVQQVGVVSYGRGCAEPFFYGIYTSVSAYLVWIGEYIDLPDDATPAATDQPRGSGSVGAEPPVLVQIDRDESEESDNSRRHTFVGGVALHGLGGIALLILLRIIRSRRMTGAPQA